MRTLSISFAAAPIVTVCTMNTVVVQMPFEHGGLDGFEATAGVFAVLSMGKVTRADVLLMDDTDREVVDVLASALDTTELALVMIDSVELEPVPTKLVALSAALTELAESDDSTLRAELVAVNEPVVIFGVVAAMD